MDALVIGAGVIGCSLAYELARRGVAVTVVSASEPGEETSAASFAWANANDKAPAYYAALNQAGLEQHGVWSPALSTTGWFHRTGHLELLGEGADLAAARANADAHNARGYTAELLSPVALRQKEPALVGDRCAGALWFPDEGWVDTQRMCSDLLTRAASFGASFVPYMTVTATDAHGATARDAAGERHRFAADVVLLAAGHGIRPLCCALGIDFPIRESLGGDAPDATLGVTCTTTPTRHGPAHMLTTDDISLRPARNGGLMLTDLATGGDGMRSRAALWRLPHTLLAHARTLYPALADVELRTVTVGTRVLPNDGLSIVDWLPGAGPVYAVATHSGVTLAPSLAIAVADEIVDGHRPQALAGFELARFADEAACRPE